MVAFGHFRLALKETANLPAFLEDLEAGVVENPPADALDKIVKIGFHFRILLGFLVSNGVQWCPMVSEAGFAGKEGGKKIVASDSFGWARIGGEVDGMNFEPEP